MTFLVVGDVNADLSAALPHFPHEGDDTPLCALAWKSGGSAANVGTALALLGAPVRLLARTGQDPAAEVALRAARAAGVDLGAVQRDEDLATGLCFAAVSPGGERTFFSYRGANTALALPSQGDVFAGVGLLHVAGHALLEGRQRDTTTALIHEAQRRGVPISLDLCLPLIRDAREATLALAPRLAVVFANEPELAAIARPHAPGQDTSEEASRDPIEEALAALEARGVSLIAAKLGARGSRLAGRAHAALPAFTVEAIDTTAAGDAYVAAFLFAMARGAPPELAARLGNAAGALTATRSGAAESLPSGADLEAFLLARGAARERAILTAPLAETRS